MKNEAKDQGDACTTKMVKKREPVWEEELLEIELEGTMVNHQFYPISSRSIQQTLT